MSIYEYNEEYARKAFYEDGAAAGYAQGREDGKNIGYAQGKEDGYTYGKDIGYAKCLLQSVEALRKKLSCSVQEACESMGATMEEYEEALKKVEHDN